MRPDPMQSELAVSDLQHRLSKLITLGTVHEVDYETARVKVKIGDWITAKLPWLADMAAHNMSWRAPEIGEQVVVLAPCGDTAQGVVLGSVYSAAADHHKPDHVLGAGEGESYPAASSREHVHRTRYQDGALVEYDTERHIYHLYVPNRDGNEQAQIHIHSARDIRLHCENDAHIQCDRDAQVNVLRDANITVDNNATLSAGNELNLTAKQSTLNINAEQGELNIKAEQGELNIEALQSGLNVLAQQGALTVKASQGALTLEGNTVSVKSTGGPLEVDAGGADLLLKGGKIKAS
ncbi:phage baseplate assembly protein V [Pseudoalteromonas rubra]|uniref:phage baseplate assembly protein V n=1 Tax=Pseudoalteromonas rubra TaxID=43658 RepID=UPI000696A1E5|nr:phage baseplate assembly protein V [Pseudoalteromonas rubra]